MPMCSDCGVIVKEWRDHLVFPTDNKYNSPPITKCLAERLEKMKAMEDTPQVICPVCRADVTIEKIEVRMATIYALRCSSCVEVLVVTESVLLATKPTVNGKKWRIFTDSFDAYEVRGAEYVDRLRQDALGGINGQLDALININKLAREMGCEQVYLPDDELDALIACLMLFQRSRS